MRLDGAVKRMTYALAAAAVLTLGLSACTTSEGEAANTPPPTSSEATQAPSTGTSGTASTETTERESAEASYLSWLRGAATEAGANVSELTDAQLVAQGNAMCERIASVEDGGGEVSVEGVVLLEFAEQFFDESDVSDAQAAGVRAQLTAVTFGAIDYLCPEYAGIPTD